MRWISLMVCWAVFSTVPASFGQTLDLQELAPRPSVEESDYTAALLRTLGDEIEHFSELQRDATDTQKTVIQGSITVRILAAELLERGRNHDQLEPLVLLHGLRLAEGRAALDDVLMQVHRELDQKLKQGGVTIAREMALLTEIERFTNIAVDQADVVREGNITAVDEALADIVAPLGIVVVAMTDVPIRSHWSGDNARAPGPGTAAPQAALATLMQRLEARSFSPETQAAVDLILEFLQRGIEHDHLRRPVLRMIENMNAVLDCADTLVRAPWVPGPVRDVVTEAHVQAMVRLADPTTREAGEAVVSYGSTWCDVIQHVAALRGESVNTTSIEHALDILVEAERDAAPGEAAAFSSHRRRLESISRVLAQLVAYREINRVELPRDLRARAARLHDEAERSERALLEHFSRLAREDDPGADPAFGTLLADHAQRVADVRRVYAIPRWLDVVGHIDGKAVDAVHVQIKRLVQSLLEPHRRSEAVRALAEWDRQITSFYPLPFERELTGGTESAILFTGGLQDEVIALINRARRDWINALRRGELDGDAAGQMMSLSRLGRAMADVAALQLDGPDAARLNRWAAWELPEALLRRSTTDLPSRLKIACASATQGDATVLRDHLDRIERDARPARIVGRFSMKLGPSLELLPGGAPSLIGQMAYPPAPGTWMLPQREIIAAWCIWTPEAELAWRDGREKRAQEIQAYVNMLADELLAVLGDTPEDPPALPDILPVEVVE